MDNYYYIAYKIHMNLSSSERSDGIVTNIHPFLWLDHVSKLSGNDEVTIINYKGITQTEADMFPGKKHIV